MNRANPQMRHFAKRLIVFEARENKSSKINIPAPFAGPQKLRPELVPLMGDGGFRALLDRALALAGGEVSGLRKLQVNADGTLYGLVELQAQLSAEEFLEAGVVLLAQLLGLLVAFIGENLTVRLVHQIWPKVPLDGLALENTVKMKQERK